VTESGYRSGPPLTRLHRRRAQGCGASREGLSRARGIDPRASARTSRP
jgi:hypothetical protein